MSRFTYDRLSAQDNMFLVMEGPNVHMHVSGTMLYESGPLRTEDGGIDVAAIKHSTESVLHLIPRYRQKLQWIPFANRPVWVDDRHFNLDYHIRHRALPRPGSMRQLKELSAYIMSRQLDRSKPLWEMWVVEGLEGDRFAVISKVHHCMIDGASGVDLAYILLSTTPEREDAQSVPYFPRPEPTGEELLRDEILHRMAMPLQAVRSLRDFGRQTEDLRQEIGKRVNALAELAGWAVSGASDTPINGPLSPHRRFDWLTMSLAQVKAARRALGCTVNDIVLATVTGAVRDYLIRRRVDPSTIDFRVSAPVSVRREDEQGRLGNRVSSWIVRLPVELADPLERIQAIRKVTEELKSSQQALGVDMIMKAAEWAPAGLVSLGAQATSGPINSIVTNVPGPQIPLYMLGARLLEMYPQVPLLENMGLGIALCSYDGKVCWGFNADFELMPDLGTFRTLVRKSFDELCGAAGVDPTKVRRRAAKAASPGDESAPVAAKSN